MYNNIVKLLEDFVSNDASNEEFADNLIEEEQIVFSDSIAILRSELLNINKDIQNQKLYGSYDIILNAITGLKGISSAYTLPKYEEIFLVISLMKVISDSAPDFSNEDHVLTNYFELAPIDNFVDIPQNFFAFENTQNIYNSIIYFEKSNYTDFESNLKSYSLSLSILYNLLDKIGKDGNALSHNNYVLIKTGHSSYPHRIVSFLLLHILSKGLEIHTSKIYSNPLINAFQNDIKVENKYQQFRETFNVMSEYNSSSDILSKYLKIYQVIEDFMYKSKLVKLETNNNGRIFKLRDFKRMNEEVSGSESTILNKFIDDVFALNYNPGQTFRRYCFNVWLALSSGHLSKSEIELLLKQFDITFIYPGTEKSMIQLFPNLIYRIRNSLVHNKTTEFHLTYFTLSNEIHKFLENFMIPVLESMVFFLTSNKLSKIVWFEKPSLEIWNDN